MAAAMAPEETTSGAADPAGLFPADALPDGELEPEGEAALPPEPEPALAPPFPAADPVPADGTVSPPEGAADDPVGASDALGEGEPLAPADCTAAGAEPDEGAED